MRAALEQLELALALHREGREREAEAAYRRCLEIDPGIAEAHNNLGAIFTRAGDHTRALAAYDEAIRVRPDYATAHNNRGGALSALGDQEGALRAYQRAVAIDPGYAKAHNNAGLTLVALDQLEDAMRSYRAAIAAQPDFAEAHCNLAYCLFTRGEFADGCAAFAWGWKNGSRGLHPGYPWPAWRPGTQSASAHPSSTLVWGEQGLGDQLFHLSVLRDFARCAGRVTVALEKRLVGLVQRSYPEWDVVPLGEALRGRKFQAQISTADMFQYVPGRGRVAAPGDTSAAFSPAVIAPAAPSPYLIADRERTAQLRERLRRPGQLLCGLSWRSANPHFSVHKSINLDALGPLLALEAVDFLDLQFGRVDADRAGLSSRLGDRYRRANEIDLTNDMEGVAALIGACDVVVSAGNTIAHIAGAMGMTTQVLLPQAEGLTWYWRSDDERSRWYAATRLYRQTHAGIWRDPVLRGTREIEQLIA